MKKNKNNWKNYNKKFSNSPIYGERNWEHEITYKPSKKLNDKDKALQGRYSSLKKKN